MNSSDIVRTPIGVGVPSQRLATAMRSVLAGSAGTDSIDKESSAPFIYIKSSEVCAILGISRSTLYARISIKGRYFDPAFPRPIHFSGHARCVRWVLSEIQNYQAAQISSRIETSATDLLETA